MLVFFLFESYGWMCSNKLLIYILLMSKKTVIYYSTDHTQELIYFDSNT